MLQPEDEPARSHEQLTAAFTHPTREKVRALLIDDDPADRLLFDKLSVRSKQLDFSLMSCASTLEAGAALRSDRFDILYVDYWMGMKTTIDFINQFARLDEAPCVLLTGLDEPDIRRLAFRAGAKAFLSKDEISTQAIEGVTLAVLHQRQPRYSARQSETFERRRI